MSEILIAIEKPSLQKISMTARPMNIRRIASLAQ